MTKKPVAKAIILDDGQVIKQSVLDKYKINTSTKRLEGSHKLKPSGSFGMYDIMNKPYDVDTLISLAEVNTYHARCVKTKVTDTVGLGWRIEPSDDEQATDKKKQKEIRMWFEQCNPDLTFEEIMVLAMSDFEHTGDAYISIVREPNGNLKGLDYIPSATMWRHRDEMRYVQMIDSKRRWFIRAGTGLQVDYETGEIKKSIPYERRGNEVIPLRNPSPKDDYYGVPDIVPALRAIYGDMERAEYNIDFFENYAIPTYAVTVTGAELDDTMIETIREYFSNLKENRYATLVIAVAGPNGENVEIKFEKLAVDVQDASFVTYRKNNRDEVLTAHGVPSYRLGINETGSLGGNTAHESTKIYKASVIKPRQKMVESRINRYILSELDKSGKWRFKFEEIDIEDEIKNTEIDIKLFSVGALTPNEIRQARGWDRIELPGMDMTYINGTPISRMMMQSQFSGDRDEDEEEKPKEVNAELIEDNPLVKEVRSLHNKLVEIAKKAAKRNDQ